MTELIGEIQSYNMDLESDEAYEEIVRPLGDIFYFTAKNYTDMRKNTVDKSPLGEVDLTDGARFYEHRMEKIKDYLNCDFSYGNYKEIEKDYWIKKAENTDIPFRWGSTSVMTSLMELIFVGMYLQFVIVICMSSVFSSEYESGAAVLLLTTKYGKDRMIWSKIAVSLLFTVGYLTVGATLVIGAAIIIAPAFFPMSRDSGLWNHINYLFPIRAFNLKEVIESYVSYTVGNVVISYIEMIVIVYTVISVVALLPIRRGFVKAR